MPYTVLFLCTGNMGRSPLAEVIARRLLAQALGVADGELEAGGIRVLSAGTHALPGFQASGRAARVAQEIGVTMGRHPSRRLTRKVARNADVIYCMDAGQAERVAGLGFPGKAQVLDPAGAPIPDPRGQDPEFYRRVRDRIVLALEQRIPEILAEARRG